MLVLTSTCKTTTRELEFNLVLAVVIGEAGFTNESDLTVSRDADLLVVDTGLDVDGVRLAVVRESGNGSRNVAVLAGGGVLRHNQSS